MQTTTLVIETSGNGTLPSTWEKIDGDPLPECGTRERTIEASDFPEFELALTFESVFHYCAYYGDSGHDCLSNMMSLAETCIELEHYIAIPNIETTEHDDQAWKTDLSFLDWRPLVQHDAF